MRKSTLAIAIVAVLLIIFLVTPFFMGMWLHRDYVGLIEEYNNPQVSEVQIQSYQRGWFKSKAQVHVNVYKQALLPYSKLFGLDEQVIPNKIEFTVNQDIQHGPLLFKRQPLFITFGLASIKNQFNFSDQAKTFLRGIGLDELFIRANDVIVSFFGNYASHLELGRLDLRYANNNAHFSMDSAGADTWFYPRKTRLKSKMKFNDVSWGTTDADVAIPNLKYEFDETKQDNNLWLGRFSIFLSDFFLKDSTGQTLTFNEVNITGKSSAHNNLLKGDRIIDVETLSLNDQSIGPLHLEIIADKLNAEAIANLINSYQQIMQQGEVYQSQLQNKMAALFPNIFTPGASLQLKSIKLNTPFGHLKSNAKLEWPVTSASVPEDIPDFIKASDLSADLRISKTLVDKFVEYATALPQFQAADDEQKKRIIEMRSDLDLSLRANTLLVLRLIQLGGLPKQTGNQLLMLQKQGLSDNYYNELKTLFLTRKISKEIAYLLLWQYLQVQLQIDAINTELDQQSAIIKTAVKSSMHDWVNRGYVQVDGDDYVVKFTRQDGQAKFFDKVYE